MDRAHTARGGPGDRLGCVTEARAGQHGGHAPWQPQRDRHPHTRRRMALCRGVEALAFDPTSYPYDEVNEAAINLLKSKGRVQSGDLVLLTKGARMGAHGQTNAMLILQVR